MKQGKMGACGSAAGVALCQRAIRRRPYAAANCRGTCQSLFSGTAVRLDAQRGGRRAAAGHRGRRRLRRRETRDRRSHDAHGAPITGHQGCGLLLVLQRTSPPARRRSCAAPPPLGENHPKSEAHFKAGRRLCSPPGARAGPLCAMSGTRPSHIEVTGGLGPGAAQRGALAVREAAVQGEEHHEGIGGDEKRRPASARLAPRFGM